MSPILQSQVTFTPWMEERTRRLPGVVPLSFEDWLVVDDAYDAQLAYKARLLAERRDTVLEIIIRLELSEEEYVDSAFLLVETAQVDTRAVFPDGGDDLSDTHFL